MAADTTMAATPAKARRGSENGPRQGDGAGRYFVLALLVIGMPGGLLGTAKQILARWRR